ncbi:hypothetical protein V6N12_021972 [Hibiscus sabdariffa]|uniref:Uncharacterized protein n=1 Tax=Hibiscus sabdariffa TaxID=183260 RepID=A0ABR2FTA0_9ROSI
MAISSRITSGNPDPLTVLTNIPLLFGAGVISPSSSSTGPGRRRDNRLRLLARRWTAVRLEHEEEEEEEEQAEDEDLLEIDLKAEVAIERRTGGEQEQQGGWN